MKKLTCAHHFRQHLLRYFGEQLFRLVLFPVAREQQWSARQPFLSRVEELVHQVRLDSNISCEHMRGEAVGEFVPRVEHAHHLVFCNIQVACAEEFIGGGGLLIHPDLFA